MSICCAPACFQRGVPVYGGVPLCDAHLGAVLAVVAPEPGPASVVYYVTRADRPNQVKIGVTKDLDRRLRELGRRKGSVTVLATEPGDRTLERARHAQFEAFRLDGEWFVLSGAIREHIADLS